MRCRCGAAAAGVWDAVPCCAYCGAVQAAAVAPDRLPLAVSLRSLDEVALGRLHALAGLLGPAAGHFEPCPLLEAVPAPESELRYALTRLEARSPGRRLLFLGRDAAVAAGFTSLDAFDVIAVDFPRGDFAAAFLPHPRARGVYNRSGAAWGAASVIRAFLGLPRPRKCVRCDRPAALDALVCGAHLKRRTR